MELFDTHCHLDFPDFKEDTEAVVSRAKTENVTGMLTIGTCVDTSRRAIEISSQFDGIYAAVGIHPNHCVECESSDLEIIRELARNKCVVAVGETGLDFYRDTTPREMQKEFFIRQMEIAVAADKPVVLHSRDSGNELVELVEDFVSTHSLRGVFHCFTAGKDVLKRALNCGLYIGISGIVTFPKGDNVREIVPMIPDDRLLLDTDSPFLAPAPYRGKRNEPAYAGRIAERLAEIRGCSFEQIAESTTKNACTLFGLPYGTAR